MRMQAFPFHLWSMLAFPPAPFPGKGVTEVRGLRPLRRVT